MTGSSPYIIALDVASNMGVAEGYADQPPRCYSVKLLKPLEATPAGMNRARAWLAERLRLGRPDYFVLEKRIPTMNGKGNTSMRALLSQITLSSELISVALAKDLTPIPHPKVDLEDYRFSISPQTVRAAFLGDGSLKGDVAKRRAKELCARLGWSVANGDEADAAAVWWWASTIVAPRTAALISPMIQREVATKVENSKIARDAGLVR